MNDLRESYWRKLGRHPGLPIAGALIVLGAIAGGWGGALVMSVYFLPVLITARRRSLPHE